MTIARFRHGCLRGASLLAALALLGACTSRGGGETAETATEDPTSSVSATAPSATATSSGSASASETASSPSTDDAATESPTPDSQPGEAGYAQSEADPLPLDSPATVADGQVKLAVESVSIDKALPGEVAGPAVRVRVTATAGSAPLDLSGASVTLSYGEEGAVAAMVTSGESQSLPASVEAGSEATGVYDFSVPEGSRDPVVVRVYVNAQDPVAVFTGTVS